MPNPTRLYQLTRLRERAGLTQVEMAQRCGLPGKQGRKTVSDWESGQATPRASRRPKLLSYLWHDLQLRDDPAGFDAVWAMLVEEWGWEPISALERQQLHQQTNGDPPPPPPAPVAGDETPLAAESRSLPVETAPADPVAAPVADDAPTTDQWPHADLALASPPLAVAPVAIAPPTLEPLPQPQAAPIAPPQRFFAFPVKWSHLALALVVALALWLGGQAYWRGRAPFFASLLPVHWLPSLPDSSGVVQLHNGGFEEGRFAPWTTLRECDYKVSDEPQLAHSGRRFLAIRHSRPGCHSFFQDVAVPLQVGESYQAAVWLRSSTGAARKGRLVVWELEWQPAHSGLDFAVANQAWVCLETGYTVQHEGNDRLRFEIYLQSPDAVEYWVDDAVVTPAGAGPLCPRPVLEFHGLRLSQPSGQFYGAATATIEGALKNLGPEDLTEALHLRAWVADQENGPAVDGVTKTIPLSPLLAGETTSPFLSDIAVPFHLETGRTYFVVVDSATNRTASDQSLGWLRASLPFALSPCFQASLYCDVPLDHWAYPEIEALFASGISQGCRSNTGPFQNRPFCPDETVKRWMVVFFFLRYLNGVDYRPSQPYQGIFVDVPPDFEHQGSLWIEELARRGFTLPSEDCPSSTTEQRFCPNTPVKRGDFVRYLAQLQQWDLPASTEPLFEDVPIDAEEATAVAYLWQQGYLDKADPTCPSSALYRRFCPNAPLRRASAAAMMSRALGLVEPGK